MPTITSIDDLRRLYHARVPKMFQEYAESGSWSQQTLAENTSDLDRLHLRQRVAVDMTERTTRTRMAGQDVAMPVALAPVGLSGMQSADGEIKAARAAAAFGVPYTLSTMSICSIEDVAENSPAPFWFQLYVMRDREFMRRLIERARVAGCPVLMLTLDLQIMGQRHADVKNGLTVPIRPTMRNLLDLARRPRWGLEMLGTKRKTFGNIAGHVKDLTDLNKLGAWSNDQFDPTLNWDDVREIRDLWPGKLILKGIMEPEDARSAAETGADAIVVSNHGGRQLDGAQSAIRALGPIVEAVGDKIEVHFDSGIRSGQDVLRARALGAKGTYVGRAFVYGLGAMGETGVTRALEVIQKELDLSMAFTGHRDIETVTADILRVPPGFSEGA